MIDLIKAKKPFYRWAGILETGYFMPLGTFNDLFKPGPYFNLKVRFNPKLFNYFLLDAEVGAIFLSSREVQNQNYRIFPFGISANYVLPLFRRLNLSGKLGGGVYLYSSDESTLTNGYLKTGLGLQFSITPKLKAALHTDYMLFFDPGQSLYALNFSLSFKYVFGTLLHDKDLKVLSLKMKKIFVAHYPVYYKKPVGMLKLKNTAGSTIKKIKVSVYIKNLMDSKSTYNYPHTLKKNEIAMIPVFLYFNKSVKKLNSDIYTTGILEIEYIKEDGEKALKRDLVRMKIYNKNAITWENLFKLGSFITVKDKNVIQFTRQAVHIALKSNRSKDFQNAFKIIQALKEFKLRYVKDPKTPYNAFGDQGIEVDYIQYPFETLKRKTGDCDDLSILVVALLESVGINTAFVTVPQHIFILFEVDENLPNTVVYNKRRWIPIETTAIGKGFYIAWQLGYKNFVSTPKDEKKVVLTSNIVSEYPPLSFQYDSKIVLNKKINIKDKKYNIKQINSAINLNQIGIRICQRGMSNLKKGEKYFLKAISLNPTFRYAYYNLMLLYTAQGKYHKALKIYKQLKKYIPYDEGGERVVAKAIKETKKIKKILQLARKNRDEADYYRSKGKKLYKKARLMLKKVKALLKKAKLTKNFYKLSKDLNKNLLRFIEFFNPGKRK